MTAITQSITQLKESIGQRFRWDYFLQDNITGSVWQTLWIVILGGVTAVYTVNQLSASPLWTIIILIAWAVFLILAIAGGLFQRHTKVGDWLRINLVSSVSNSLLTLFLMLLLAGTFRAAWSYGVTNATFDPTLTAPEARINSGATWGFLAATNSDPEVQGGARDLLYYGRLDRQFVPRVQTAVWIFFILSILTFAANRTGLWKSNRLLRQILTYIWVASPIVLFILLNGVAYKPGSPLIDFGTLLSGLVILLALYGLLFWQRVVKFSLVGLIITAVAWPIVYVVWRLIAQSEAFPVINVDTWGGLMLTLIIAVSVILLSFPMGMVLALGRRSEVRGIPSWLVWPVAIGIAIWGFTQTTPQLLEDARNLVERLIAFWPLLVLAAAWGLQRAFKGNVVAAATTIFIELVRGVPLITLLFMAIIMAPFFVSGDTSIKNPYSVIIGYTVFASAYMAELIRGGLQAIPRGQFEAADALGLNTLQKMRFIVLPQALRILIPALVGSFIGNFKSSSLVSIVGLFDLVGIAAAVSGNPQWQGLKPELYYSMAIFYFLVSFGMSSYSRRLEVKLGTG
ncbi:MAG: amino acid ABC transporter permease [Chloroflexi bacterium]|nr:amino acid ABC transporter permease [Chloroflexota bacterium]